MNTDDFQFHLSQIINGTEVQQLDSRTAIINLRATDIVHFFELCVNIFENPLSPPSSLIICFSAIRDLFTASRELPIAMIKANWSHELLTNIRSKMKTVLIKLLQNDNEPVRNMSAFIISRILLIEGKNKWPDLFTQLNDLFTQNSYDQCIQHGVLTAFHEILCQQVFQNAKKIDPDVLTLVDTLILFLSNSTSEIVLYYTIRCILDISQNIPIIFQEKKRVEMILNAYPLILPRIDKVHFEIMFDILFEIVKNVYEHVEEIMEQIFDLCVKGIGCPNNEIITISINFWIQFCNFEKYRKTNSKKTLFITKKVMMSLFDLLVKIISQNNRQTGEPAMALLRRFTLLYQDEMLQLTFPIITQILIKNENLSNSANYYTIEDQTYHERKCSTENIQNIENNNETNANRTPQALFVVLSLINSLCDKPSQKYHFLINYFNDIINIFYNSIDPVPFAAICALNRIVYVCDHEQFHITCFKFVIDLLKKEIPQNYLCGVYQLIISLIKSSNKNIVNKNFKEIFDVVFKHIQFSNPEAEEIINDQFSVLVFLLKKVTHGLAAVSESYHPVFDYLVRNIEFLQCDQDHLDLRLLNLINLIGFFIMNLRFRFEVFYFDLVNTLMTCFNNHQNLVFEEVLSIFSILCAYLNNKMQEFVPYFQELIIYGLRTQSPGIINNSIILCCNLVSYVDQSCFKPVQEIFVIIDQIPEGPIRMILPTFIEYVGTLLNELGDSSDFPFEVLNKYKSIVDIQLNEVLHSNDLEYATQIFTGGFSAYAAYFKYNHTPIEEVVIVARNFIKKVVLQCLIQKAYNVETIFRLCDLLIVLGKCFKSKISISMNHKFIRSVLTDDSFYKNEVHYLEIQDKFRKTLDFIEKIN
ncbi:hypothetical protein TRFO_25438 [Tritrichomonas foetus]|uniref:Importin N-terminal domain-containing protein n=1 Tax=Tritrichomonas foetus TaxID=1144522 RepID=A0A1J4K524_9EUKA|nr:hypothetical protein TRFO_25438 [Tritrichomonas foetus]|eukprot:OHT06545.1 hypothetical protein TRFO_25438 [Tritrichomonas foetus]